MNLVPRRVRPTVLAASVLVTSAAVGLAWHWFAAWLLTCVGFLAFVSWSLRMNVNHRRAIQAARSELERVSTVQRTLRADIDQTRNEARAVQQEARADLELLRAEVAVAANPDDPEDQPGR